jgi:lysophospholipase L1-like esterase
MRRRSILVILATFAIAVGGLATVSSSAEPATGHIYLALGDSLAAGYQPSGVVREGYADQLFQLEQARIPNLRLKNLGCPGETTSSISRARRACAHPEGSQLDQAVAVLAGGDVAFVTLQIGSNDTFRCFDFDAGAFDQACIDALLPKLTARLTSIVGTLRAADPDVPIVGSNYIDPLLALWTAPGTSPDGVRAIADVWTATNDAIEATYAATGVPVADHASAFSSDDFDSVVHVHHWGDLPLNVARICQWTYMCPDTYGHDPHPTSIGYAVLTQAWEAALATALAPA